MPNLLDFNINKNHLEEVLRVKRNLGYKSIPPKIPNRVNTINPTDELSQSEWFEHLHKTLREMK